jgi:hypothetical protein
MATGESDALPMELHARNKEAMRALLARAINTDQAVLIDLAELKEHENIEPAHLEEIKSQILKDGILKQPIVVDERTKIILDGHFRFNALKQLGCTKIPVLLVDYSSPYILVKTWRRGESVTKSDVIRAGLTGRKLPPKTTKHMLLSLHVSEIAGEVDIPLDRLRGGTSHRRRI